MLNRICAWPIPLFLLLSCSLSRGQSASGASPDSAKPPMPVYIEEFFLSDAVRNEDKGEWQFTLVADSRQQLGTNAALELEYGLTDRVQFSFDMPYGLDGHADAEIPAGWSSASLGFQYQVARSGSPLALTVGIAIGVPLKSQGELEYEPVILAARTFGKLQVHASLEAEIEKWNPSLAYNVASVYPVKRQWFPTLEFNGRRLNGENGFYITPGLYRRFSHRLEFGVGIPTGVAGIAGRVGIVGKLTWEIGGDRESD